MATFGDIPMLCGNARSLDKVSTTNKTIFCVCLKKLRGFNTIIFIIHYKKRKTLFFLLRNTKIKQTLSVD